MSIRNSWLCAGIAALAISGCDASKAPPVASEDTSSTAADVPADGAADTGPTAAGARTLAAQALATRAMTAWRAADVAALAALAPPDRGSLMSAITPGSPRWEWLFGDDGWRAEAAKAWDGKVGAVRFKGARGLVEVGTRADGEVVLVDVRVADGDALYFYGITHTSAAGFARFGAAE